MTIKYILSKIIKKFRFSSVKNSTVHSTSKVESGTLFVDSSMDKHSFCGYDNEIINTNIGSFCSIGNDVKIGGGEHPYEWVSTSPVFYSGRDSVKAKFSEFDRKPLLTTTVGNDVWIGQNSLIKQGVNIGHGAIVGMGSVVTKNVDPYTIVAGIPAKKIKLRFEKEIIEELLKSKWWSIDEAKLKTLSQNIKDPVMFLKKIKESNI